MCTPEFGFRVVGFRFRVWDIPQFGFRVRGIPQVGFRGWDIPPFRFRVWGIPQVGFRVWGRDSFCCFGVCVSSTISMLGFMILGMGL